MISLKKLLFLLTLFCASISLPATETGQSVFRVQNPDYHISPYTGMTRESWKDAARYLLEGAFSYINSPDDPMKFPHQSGKSYPQNDSQIPTEKLEGLCRTLFIAAPLLRENPGLEIHGIKVAEYYRHQILKLLDRQSAEYIQPRAKNGGPAQNLVEFGALAISLFSIPEILWDPLTIQQKNALAATMLSYGDGPTIDSNWRFFNIFILSFFKSQGYDVNDKLLEEYLQKSLLAYRGYGWYNDSPAYDYYSMWAFQMYGAIWSGFFGEKYYPRYAESFQHNFSDLTDNYPYLFGRSGKMIMWGRSISYRMGSVVPFPLMGLHDQQNINYGWMRRISSGVLLQFLQHPGFLQDRIPTLGFYGPFEPAVQIYSCRGSVFWMGKVFLGLLIPANSSFWTAKENEGPWGKKMNPTQVYNKFQPGSNILITDYPGIGAAEVRAWCHAREKDDWQKFRSTENYNRLSYNSEFPWQADGKNGEVAMNYLIKSKKGLWEPLRLYTFRKFENGIYYRDAVLESDSTVRFSLAEMPLPNGILRVDGLDTNDTTLIRFGGYALPQLQGAITTSARKIKGYKATIIDNGTYQLATIPLVGWEQSEIVNCSGLHPESEQSTVVNLPATILPSSAVRKWFVVLHLWKKSGESWSNADLFPLKNLKTDIQNNRIIFKLKSGKRFIIQ